MGSRVRGGHRPLRIHCAMPSTAHPLLARQVTTWTRRPRARPRPPRTATTTTTASRGARPSAQRWWCASAPSSASCCSCPASARCAHATTPAASILPATLLPLPPPRFVRPQARQAPRRLRRGGQRLRGRRADGLRAPSESRTRRQPSPAPAPSSALTLQQAEPSRLIRLISGDTSLRRPSSSMLCYAMLWQAFFILLYESTHLVAAAMPCHAMPCHAMPCHAMPCHAMPC